MFVERQEGFDIVRAAFSPPSVLAYDQINLAENLDEPEGCIIEVPYRGSANIEHAPPARIVTQLSVN